MSISLRSCSQKAKYVVVGATYASMLLRDVLLTRQPQHVVTVA